MHCFTDQKFVVEWRDVHLKDQNGRSDEGTEFSYIIL
jgi:hypothetical protein